jgi:hypothetical protein
MNKKSKKGKKRAKPLRKKSKAKAKPKKALDAFDFGDVRKKRFEMSDVLRAYAVKGY